MAPYRKRLEGVTATPDLWTLYDECLAICQKGEGKPLLTSAPTDSETVQSSSQTTALLLALSFDEARAALINFQEDIKKKRKRPKILPISVIRAFKVVFQNNNNNDDSVAKLEEALSKTQLAFTPPDTSASEKTPEQKKFRARMERLRLQNEESKYYNLTSNIGNAPISDDHITTKSMTYAASVGLNMIVAPLSFGVFMYFFSGPVLNFLFEAHVPTHEGQVDIRKVIIGVVSGVAMLFIEMILFVIRTHELENALRKKAKKKGTAVKPFGEYSSNSKKTYITPPEERMLVEKDKDQ